MTDGDPADLGGDLLERGEERGDPGAIDAAVVDRHRRGLALEPQPLDIRLETVEASQHRREPVAQDGVELQREVDVEFRTMRPHEVDLGRQS